MLSICLHLLWESESARRPLYLRTRVSTFPKEREECRQAATLPYWLSTISRSVSGQEPTTLSIRLEPSGFAANAPELRKAYTKAETAAADSAKDIIPMHPAFKPSLHRTSPPQKGEQEPEVRQSASCQPHSRHSPQGEDAPSRPHPPRCRPPQQAGAPRSSPVIRTVIGSAAHRPSSQSRRMTAHTTNLSECQLCFRNYHYS